MKILIYENRTSLSHQLEGLLTDMKHDVRQAYSFFQAQQEWKDWHPDCLIVDLNMDPTGLEKDEIEMTKGGHHTGLLTGWVWLKKYVFNKEQGMKERTVIYSQYLPLLRKYVANRPEEKSILEAGYQVEKSEYDSADKVVSFVKRIASQR